MDILLTTLTLILGVFLGMIIMLALIGLHYKRRHTQAVINNVSDRVINARGYKSITLDC